ncbi:MAG: hypothetical protein M3Y86_07680 [Verrucomicrobiota bacterium]|nr:hypothetical protein [Verrucomicrobiota bacterium]
MAFERATIEWPRFLQENCGGDDALRAEVESLSHYRDAAPPFIDQPAIQLGAEMLLDDAILPAGTRFGIYVIRSLIGAAGWAKCISRRTPCCNARLL